MSPPPAAALFRRKAVLLGTSLLVVAAAPVHALDPSRAVSQYRHQSWSTKQGLPQSSVESILQTRDGYLWVGTQEGLARFDGVRFVVFDKSNTKALRANRVVALCEDAQGALWIGTEGGGLTRLNRGAFVTWRESDGLPNDRVRAIVEDAAGRVWVGTDRGLARMDGEKVVAGGLAERGVRSLAAAKDGTVWAGLRDGTVVPFRQGAIGDAISVPGTAAVTALFADGDGTLWVGRRDALVHVAPGGAVRAFTARDGLPGRAVLDIARDRDGALWAATENGGLARLRGDRFEVLTTREGLSNNMVQQVFEDREGNLWVGTQDGGLDRLADGKFVTWTTREGLAGDIVWPVLGDREGSLWVGTSNAGLSRFRDGRFTTYTTRDGLSSNSVQALAADAEGALWVGTRGGGLNRLKDGRWTRWSTREGLPSDSVSALLADRDGRLWIGMRDGIAWMERGRIALLHGPGVEGEVAHYFHQDRRGDVWIATNGRGLVRYSGGKFTSYTTREGLSSDIVNVVHEDEDGALWVGTFGGGLNRLREGGIDTWTTADGLFDDAIFQILEDGRGNLWMSCNKGIFRVAKRELDEVARGERRWVEPVAYGELDGMRNHECNGANQPAGWRMPDGRLYFPTIEGLVMVDPDRMYGNRVAPAVVLEQVRANEEPVALTASLDFPPDRESFEFHYTALGLSMPERVRFRYKLDGLDRDWVDAGTRRVAYYTRIPPGRYRFVVTAANEDGVWNEAGASVPFRLRPRFWRTGWFLALSAAVVGATGVFGYRLRVRHLHRREERLVRLVEERTRQLEEANRTLERLSQLDGLTGVANRRRFDEALDAEWRRGCRTGAPLSLVLVDIDAFKAFNDTYGHLRGDECLRQVAAALAGALARAGDLVARYGGEEFAALLSGVGAEEAAVAAERLRSSVQALRVPHGASPAARVVTVSVGVATLVPTEHGAASALVAAADQALYEAKRRGRNRVEGEGIRA